MRLIDADALREKLIALNYHTRAENMNEACVRAVDYTPTIGGWISVQERLPEERGRYLCWFGKNTFCVGADIATYLPEWHGFGILESDTVLQNVTHWMPLPEPPEEVIGMPEVCIDNRFEIIADYKRRLVEGTNIETKPEEMAVLDSILFRFWQMGWLPELPEEVSENATD